MLQLLLTNHRALLASSLADRALCHRLTEMMEGYVGGQGEHIHVSELLFSFRDLLEILGWSLVLPYFAVQREPWWLGWCVPFCPVFPFFWRLFCGDELPKCLGDICVSYG
ncbi:hypothetical protein C8J56DRAFT_988064 [Mycena floridula]|nr:hypothetical protein C8J56DRAFT_988064 [Mycena floridula]